MSQDCLICSTHIAIVLILAIRLGVTAMAMADQLDEFNLRVARISKSGNTSYYDPELKMNIPKRVSKDFINRNRLKKAGYSMLPISLAIGAFALMLSHLLCCRFGLVSHDAPMMIYGSAGIVALLIGGMVRLKSVPHMGAQFAGVGAMIATMHNLVWMFPEQFALIYSAEFVSMVQATTTAGSLSFMGTTYIL